MDVMPRLFNSIQTMMIFLCYCYLKKPQGNGISDCGDCIPGPAVKRSGFEGSRKTVIFIDRRDEVDFHLNERSMHGA